jgi:hypothetical protein
VRFGVGGRLAGYTIIRMRAGLAAVLVALIASQATTGAVQTTVDFAAIDEALTLARVSSDTARARFHEAYRLIAARAPVDYLEVVSPYRRIVIAAQQQAAAGNRSFGQRQALEILGKAGGQIDLYVEMTFNPLNTLIGVPEYDVALVGRGNTRIGARSIDRLSRWTPRIDGLPAALPSGGSGPPRGQPLLGATLIARFDLQSIDPEGSYDVVISERGDALASVRLDLARLR